MCHKINSVVLKLYNESDVEQLGMCTVKLRHKDKNVKSRFFVVPGDSTALLGMPDIKLLSLLWITHDVIVKPHENRKFDSQTIEMSNSPSSRTKKISWSKTDKVGMCDGKINKPDYFWFSANQVADKRVNEVLTHEIHNEFSNIFSAIGCFERTLRLQVKYGSWQYQAPLRRVTYALQQ